jgi:hypothetical protein
MRKAAGVAAAAFAAILAGGSVALAHEPLWGETPTIFGPHVFHPEIRFGVRNRGSGPDPGGESMDRLDQEFGLQYGINRFVNVRVTIPAVRTDVEVDAPGGAETRVSGIGDALLIGKYRFRLRQETSLQKSQALVVGWKLPTGDDDREGPDGARLLPSDQPGSGRHGIEIGYAADIERLDDSALASLFYMHDFGEGFRRGDMVELDAAYGRWLVRPDVADDLGFNLAFGIHAEASADDRLDGEIEAGNAHQVAGVHVTPIISKGTSQYRVGIFVTLLKGGDETETDFGYEVRAGWEMFF